MLDVPGKLNVGYLANYQKGKISESNMKIVEGIRISQNKYIELVKIGAKYYALAVCKDTVTVICEVPEDELEFKDNTAMTPDFSSILDKFRNHKDNDEK